MVDICPKYLSAGLKLLTLLFCSLLLSLALIPSLSSTGKNSGPLLADALDAQIGKQISFPCQDATLLMTAVTINGQDGASTIVVRTNTALNMNVYIDFVGERGDAENETTYQRENATIILKISDSKGVPAIVASKEINITANSKVSQISELMRIPNGFSSPGNYMASVFLISPISAEKIPEILTPVQHLRILAIDEFDDMVKISGSTDLHGVKATNLSRQPEIPYDDFSNASYTLKGGQYSPNCKWQAIFTGHGKIGVRTEHNSTNRVFFLETPPVSGPSTVNPDNQTTAGTHAALVLTTVKNYKNFHLSLDTKTIKQTRIGVYPANPWETGWIFFKYVDPWHHYYFVSKPNGVEFGKKDNNLHREEQVDLISEKHPKSSIGSWQHIDIVVDGTRFQAYVNGTRVLDYTDKSMDKGPFADGGAIGLYCEDAEVVYDNVYITRLP